MIENDIDSNIRECIMQWCADNNYCILGARLQYVSDEDLHKHVLFESAESVEKWLDDNNYR